MIDFLLFLIFPSKKWLVIGSFLEPLYRRWDKHRPIPFDFVGIAPGTRTTVRAALGVWQRATCLRFEEGALGLDRLEFFDGGGCSSFVGRIGKRQFDFRRGICNF